MLRTRLAYDEIALSVSLADACVAAIADREIRMYIRDGVLLVEVDPQQFWAIGQRQRDLRHTCGVG